jgi:3-hydroxyacyl-CoA dehydrogenase
MEVDEIKQIAVIGAGLMGHGIAQEFAAAGYDVHLNDLSEQILGQARENIARNLHMLADLGLVPADQAESVPDRIGYSSDLRSAVASADLVIESVSENLSVKHRILADLDDAAPDRAILASNSSSFMPSQLAEATRRPDRVLVAHYFNPPYLLPLVEIVRGPETSDESVTAVYELMARIGKSPVIARKEAPGFIGNRLQVALLREALAIVEQGIASAEDVDRVVMTSFGRRLAAAGPIEIFDLAGWDVIYGLSHLFADIDARHDVPPAIIERVEKGELGVKTGKGFYNWDPDRIAAARTRIAETLIAILRLNQG